MMPTLTPAPTCPARCHEPTFVRWTVGAPKAPMSLSSVGAANGVVVLGGCRDGHGEAHLLDVCPLLELHEPVGRHVGQGEGTDHADDVTWTPRVLRAPDPRPRRR